MSGEGCRRDRAIWTDSGEADDGVREIVLFERLRFVVGKFQLDGCHGIVDVMQLGCADYR